MRLSEVMSRCNSFLNITIISSKIFYQFYSITLCIFFLLLIQPAQAIDYTFSDNSSVYPAGCAMDSPGNYTCGAFSFAAGDSVIIGNTKPATITFNGAVTLGAGVYVNAAGATNDLSVVVNGAITLGASSSLNANLETLNAGAVTIGANSWISGNVVTDIGFVLIGAATIPSLPPPAMPQTGVGGSINTVTGYVSMGADSVINGAVTTASAGYLVLGANAKVGGDVLVLGAGYVVLGANAEVNGSVTAYGTTGADYITTGVGSKVNGDISASGSYIVLAASTEVNGNISTQNSYITVGANCNVSGQIAIHDPVSAIGIGAGSSVYSVCCHGGGGSCAVDGSGLVPGPLICQTPPSNAVGFDCVATSTNQPWDASGAKSLYTKLNSTGFSFDVVALDAANAQEANYVGNNISVELVEGSGTSLCASRAVLDPSVLTTLDFTESDNGRKATANIVVDKAYASLRCRVTDSNQSPSLVACSSDAFAVRPQSFVISSAPSDAANNGAYISANADNNGSDTNAMPIIKAGTAFSLSAKSAVGYNGAPSLNFSASNSLLSAHVGAQSTGILAGAFSAAASTGIATGDNFTYSEVGYVKLEPNALIDNTFTAVDQSTNDCSDDFSNSLDSEGKYGCDFGNALATDYFGRFTPHHFELALVQGCSSGDFTYARQPMSLTVTAKNGLLAATAVTTTTNYNYNVASTSESFAKTVALSVSAVDDAGDDLDSGNDIDSSVGSIVPAAIPTGMIHTHFADGVAVPTPAFVLSETETEPMNIKFHLLDSDGVSASGYDTTALTKIISGRVHLLHALGSEKLPLAVPVTIESYAGSAQGWQKNNADTCTLITGDNFSFVFSDESNNQLSACDVAITVSTTNNNTEPRYRLILDQNGAEKVGWADIELNLNPDATPSNSVNGSTCTVIGSISGAGTQSTPANIPWLQHNWIGANGNPTSRAVFGINSTNASPIVNRQESY